MEKNDINFSYQIENKAQHRNDIDALRVFAVILLIYFHTAMIFNVWSVFHIQNDDLSLEFALFVEFFNIWHMPLFFFLAGISTYYALNFRSGKEYSKERVKRLIIPLIFGILIVIPPQVYLERIAWWCETRHSPINFNGSYFEFYPLFFIPVYPNGNLSWHHLWFLWYLFVVSMMALPLLLWLKGEKGEQKISKLGNFFNKGPAIFLLFLPIFISELSLRWLFPGEHNFIFDWASILHYFIVFFLGFLIVSNKRFENAISRNKIGALILSIITSIFILIVDAYDYFHPININVLAGFIIWEAIWNFSEWCWLITFIGYARKYLNKSNKFINYTRKIALPYYILHQTVIIIIGYYIIQWSASIIIKYLIISTGALFITFLLCVLVKTNNITRFMFGMKKKN